MATQLNVGERVLLVDPDPSHRADLAAQLRGAGFTVADGPGWAETLDAEPGFAPTAVVADMRARGPGGVTVVEAVRATEEGASLPVLVMGDGNHVDEFQEMLQFGRVWYIARQAAWAHFERTFQTMLARAEVSGRSL